MLEAINISYSIGSAVLLDQVSVQAQAGELLVIAGPNGAGKSTLLKVLSEKTVLTSGHVILNRTNLDKYDPKEISKIRAVLSQAFSTTLPFQSEEIIMMGRYPYFKEYPNQIDHTIVSDIMHELDIAHLAKRVYATLSGGEQQRVQLARVLAQIWKTKDSGTDTKYLFLDEPISSLDLYHQQTVLHTASRLAQAGYCVIAVLHDLNMISQYADKVLLMSKGHVVAYGTAADVFTKGRIKEVYGLDVHLVQDTHSEQLIIIPDTTQFRNKQLNINKDHDNSNTIVDRTLESI